jgi:hypothetical protein
VTSNGRIVLKALSGMFPEEIIKVMSASSLKVSLNSQNNVNLNFTVEAKDTKRALITIKVNYPEPAKISMNVKKLSFKVLGKSGHYSFGGSHLPRGEERFCSYNNVR